MRKYFLAHSMKSALPQYYIGQDIIGKEVYGLMSVMNMDVQILKKKKKEMSKSDSITHSCAIISTRDLF